MMKKLLPTIIGASLLAVCSQANAEGEASLGYKQAELNGTDLQVLFVEYEQKVNNYVSLSLYGGTGLNDEVTSTLDDTYVNDINSTTVITDSYEQTAKMKYEAGVSLNVTYPVINGWSVYGRLGYVAMQTEQTSYNEFAEAGDTPPAADPATEFSNGASLCAATGQESQCGVVISESSVESDFDMGYSELGLKWNMGDDATLSVGYMDTISSGDSYDAFILRFGVGFW